AGERRRGGQPASACRGERHLMLPQKRAGLTVRRWQSPARAHEESASAACRGHFVGTPKLPRMTSTTTHRSARMTGTAIAPLSHAFRGTSAIIPITCPFVASSERRNDYYLRSMTAAARTRDMFAWVNASHADGGQAIIRWDRTSVRAILLAPLS